MHLNKIYISNARRFGKDIEIEFGAGATIILAPNGTGKTTVFEAIEFALTGAIQRLDDPPLSLIRDNQPEMEIRLEFDEGKVCSVNYKSKKKPVLSGDHDLIFNKRSLEEVPYLLRLTHLLEQRGVSWFVQQNKSDAGGILEKLSIGRDLSTISATKTSAIRAANQSVEHQKLEAIKSKQELSNFNAILEKRKMSAYDFVLTPLEELVVKLNEINAGINLMEQKIEVTLPSIISYNAQALEIIGRKLEHNNQKSILLSKLKTLLPEYTKLNNQISLVQEKIAELKLDFSNKETLYVVHAESLSSSESKLKQLEIEMTGLLEKRKQLLKKESLRNAITKLSQEFEALKQQENEKQIAFEVSAKKLQGLHLLNEKVRLFKEKEGALYQQKGEFIKKTELIEKWSVSLKEISEIEGKLIPEFNQKKTALIEEIQNLKYELDNLESRHKKIHETIYSLKNASDKVQEAVAMISTNLADDQGDCPVCGAEYSADELKSRIKSALEFIDPILISALTSEKELLPKIETIKIKLREREAILIELNKKIEDNFSRIKTNNTYINNTLIPVFHDIASPSAALGLLQAEIKLNESSLNAIKVEITNLGEIPPDSLISEVIVNKTEIESDWAALKDRLQHNSEEKSMLSLEFSSLNEKLARTKNEEINVAISSFENTITQLQKEFSLAGENHANLALFITEIRKHIAQEETILIGLQVKINEIKTEWLSANLEGVPDETKLNAFDFHISSEKNLFNVAKPSFVKINEELARWKSASEFQRIDTEIKSLVGSQTEELFKKQLEDRSKKDETLLKVMEEKRKVLDAVYTHVGTELEGVHSYLTSINANWTAMLRRVVVNPIFANTTLSSYSQRNKSQADIHINLHNTKTKVTDVASEAQITDLQLTFLLAMASKYQWSTWKGLLLDDPTQHHDLVHAASVFDLLRDFITTQKSQIILGTHDSVHANFFKRKCQNDNIPINVWHLMADTNGVRAELRQ